MSSIKRILVPTDFSVYSDTAVDYAADLARRLCATLELIHVVEDPFVSGAWAAEAFAASSAGLLEEVAASAKARLTAIAVALGAKGVIAAVTVVTGPPAAAIADYAREGGFDLIVIGTHGRTGLSHAVLGSVAERVQRTAPCAVLTVKTKTTAPAHVAVQHAAATA